MRQAKQIGRHSPASWGLGIASALLFATSALSQVQTLDYEGVDDLPIIELSDAEGTAPNADAASAQDIIDYVTAASKGKIKITPYWSGSLLNLIETPQGVADGVADMGYTLPVYTPADYPVTNWINTIASQLKGGQPYGELVALGANSEFFATDPTIRKEYDDHGLHIIGVNGSTAYDLLCNKRVSTMDEARGTSTRTANQAVAKEVEAAGFASVSVVANELYEAFSRGIVKCAYLFPAGYQTLGLTDVASDLYWVHIPLSGWMATVQVMNKNKWESLPPLAQEIITDAYVYYLQQDAAKTYSMTRRFGQMIRDGKIEAVQPEQAMLDALKAHQDKELAAMVTTNVPPQVTDPQGMVDRYMGLLEKWRRIVGDELQIPDTPPEAADVVDAWFIDYDFAPFQARLREELQKAVPADQPA